MEKFGLVFEEKEVEDYGQYLLDTMIERLGVPSNPKLPEIKEIKETYE